MKTFVSWSGGKDCMLALHRLQQSNEHEIMTLVNMCDDDGEHSRSHGIHKSLIKAQAKALNIPVLQPMTNIKNYEAKLKESIEDLKSYGVEAGVFGDIYLEAHREWIERVCSEMNIEAIFPIWGENTGDLLEEFIAEEFKSIIVSVNPDMLAQEWLGKIINCTFLEDISKIEGVDPCAENGEYHSFVFNGPNFCQALELRKTNTYQKDKNWFLNINLDK